MIWDKELPYFPTSELACKCCGVIKLDMILAVHLPKLRHEWAKPLTPTSVCRCPKRNKAVKGHLHSLHLTENPTHGTKGSLAIDIAWAKWETGEKLLFAQYACKVGWSIGLHNAFVHLDRRTDIGLPQTVFLYGEWSDQFDVVSVWEKFHV